MNLKRFLQTRLRVALVCVVRFLLLRMLGETMASGVLKLAESWSKAQNGQRGSVND